MEEMACLATRLHVDVMHLGAVNIIYYEAVAILVTVKICSNFKILLYIICLEFYELVWYLIFPAAIVEKTIFCCHGGLSPDLHDLDQVRFCFHIACFSQSIIQG